MDEIWDARRKVLQDALVKAALDLSGHMGAAGFIVPIENTSPALVVELRQAVADDLEIDGGEG